MNFNNEQLDVINHTDGNLMCIAPAGSGKTSTLLQRIKTLVESGEEEQEILTISFTNASATELQTKLNKMGLDEVQVGTFHAVCKDIIETYYDQNGILIDLFNQPNKYKVKREFELALGIKNANVDDILSWISYQKSHGLMPKDIKTEKDIKFKATVYTDDELIKCFRVYEEYKKKHDCYDFDDWLLMCLDICEINDRYKWKYVLADENQDANIVQHKLLKMWCLDNNIMVIGDVCQSIYAFRAATPELFMNFDKSNKDTKVINLLYNYRSLNNIVENANKFISKFYGKYEHYRDAIAFSKEDGKVIGNTYVSRNQEAREVVVAIQQLISEGVELKDIAILYRNNYMSDNIESQLKHNEIDYNIFSSLSFFDRKEIKGIISILRLALDTSDDEAFEYVLTTLRCYPVNYFRGDLITDIKHKAGRVNSSLFDAFSNYSFEHKWQKDNAKIFVDKIDKIKNQNNKHLPLDKIIDYIVKSFNIRDLITGSYERTVWEDKFESIENLKSFAIETNLEGFIKFVTTIKPSKEIKNNAVSLMTIHRSKGLEFDHVFLIGLEEDKFPKAQDCIEEARLMYVAVTRAKKYLSVSTINDSSFYDLYFSK